MAKLRKWCAYRTIERPYTRYSNKRKKAFVKSRPGKKVIKFDMGDLKGGEKQFPLKLELIAKEPGLIRTNAIEAARVTSLRLLETTLGRQGFYFRIHTVPHHAVRENPLAAGAGADRLSTGMKHSFGKIIAMAARVEKGKVLLSIYVPKEAEDTARAALQKALKKLPTRAYIVTTAQKVVELTDEQKAARQAEMEKQAKQAALRKAKEAAAAEKKEE